MKVACSNRPELFIVVDDEDYPVVSRHKWAFNKRAIFTKISSNDTVPLARFIMGPTPKGYYCWDHIDRNPLNNKKENLRLATRTLNNCNRTAPKRKDNLPTGIYKRRSGFIVTLKINKSNRTFGTFHTLEEALSVRNNAYKEREVVV